MVLINVVWSGLCGQAKDGESMVWSGVGWIQSKGRSWQKFARLSTEQLVGALQNSRLSLGPVDGTTCAMKKENLAGMCKLSCDTLMAPVTIDRGCPCHESSNGADSCVLLLSCRCLCYCLVYIWGSLAGLPPRSLCYVMC